MDTTPDSAVDVTETDPVWIVWPIYYRFAATLVLISIMLLKHQDSYAALTCWPAVIGLILLPGIGLCYRDRWVLPYVTGLDCTVGAFTFGILAVMFAFDAAHGFQMPIVEFALELVVLAVTALSVLECLDLLRTSKESSRSRWVHLAVGVFSFLIGVQLGMPL